MSHGGHSHDHDHSAHKHEGHGHDHSHAHAVTADSERRVFWVMLLTGGFMIAEAVGGILSGSLALLADAGHMLTDSASLALAWFAFRLGRKPSDARRSYGYHRFQVLAAFVNGLTLFAIAGWILIEAVKRFVDPVPILGVPMLVVAALGLLVNVIAFWILQTGERDNLNIRGAVLHVLGDLLGSVGAIAAAGVILAIGWTPIDPILSVLVALLILRSAWKLVRDSGHILLEGTPDDLDPARIGAALRGAVPGVTDVHHVHAWSLTGERPLITLHAVVNEIADQNETVLAINNVLAERFGIDHATVQLERGCCLDGGHPEQDRDPDPMDRGAAHA